MSSIELIVKIPLFQGLARNQYEDLAKIAADQVFRKGERIFSEDDEGKGFYVTVSGRVKIFKISPEGKEQILHIFGPGEPFGEVAVFTGRRFPASAEALEDTRAFFFPRTDFIGLIRKDPSLALNMLAVLVPPFASFLGPDRKSFPQGSPGETCSIPPDSWRRKENTGRTGSGCIQEPTGQPARNDPGNLVPHPGQDDPGGIHRVRRPGKASGSGPERSGGAGGRREAAALMYGSQGNRK